MRFRIGAIIKSITARQRTLRTLRSADLKFHFDNRGRIRSFAGNCATIFPVEYRGEPYALRCYMQQRDNLRSIYGARYYSDELEVGREGQLTDVVLTPWVEGEPLDIVVERCCKARDIKTLTTLSTNFFRLAEHLTSQEWAHGDLSGDNIVVDKDLSLHLIDFDSCYIPEFEGRQRTELGNRSYQSPIITPHNFNSRMDDYPILIIATSLIALAKDPSLKERYGVLDSLLITAADCAEGKNQTLIDELLSIFAQSGDFVAHEMCQLIRSCSVKVDHLPELLRFQNGSPSASCDLTPSRPKRLGRWGYAESQSGEMVLPPLFDYVEEFVEKQAIVQQSGWWHIIDCNGKIIKPLGYSKEFPEY